MTYAAQDIKRFREDLKFHIEAISRDMLGMPVNRNASRELKYGSKGGSLSVTIARSSPYHGTWKDWQTGEGGDALSLIQKVKGLSFLQALEYARERYSVGRLDPQQEEGIKAIWTPLFPVPEKIPEPDLNNAFLAPLVQGKEVTAQYAYRDEENRLLGYVMRVESDALEGRRVKETLPLTYCQNQWGKRYWRWKGFASPKPLYGLEKLKEGKPVLIVEGEKTAEAAQKLFPEYTVLTWNGGTPSVSKADWTPLRGRDVTLWPDHDEAGRKAVQEIASILMSQDAQTSVSLITVPDSFPPKWDLADPLPSGFSSAHIKSLLEKAPSFVSSDIDVKTSLSSGQEMNLDERLKKHLNPFSESLFGSPVRQEERTLYFGEEGHLSVTRSGKDKGKWWDTKERKGGDILDLVMHPLSSEKPGIHSLKDKRTWLEEWVAGYEKAHPSQGGFPEKEQATQAWVPQEDVPKDAVPLFTLDAQGRKIFTESIQSADYKILEAYAYHDRENRVLGYRLEVEKDLLNGKQTRSFLPVRWCERQREGKSEKAWRMARWEAPRPLFGLEHLAQKPSANVLIVEGEKAALQARACFPDLAVVTWMTETSDYKVDWTPLKDRNVFIWSPDQQRQRQRGRFLLQQGINHVHALSVPSELSQGWNFDQPLPSRWTQERLKDLVQHPSPLWSAGLSSFRKKAEKEKGALDASKPSGAIILDFPLTKKTSLEKKEGTVSLSENVSNKEVSDTGNDLKKGKRNPAFPGAFPVQDAPLVSSLEKERLLSEATQGNSSAPPSAVDSKRSPEEQEAPSPASPPYGQVTAAAALAQLLSFPILTAAELAQGAKKGIQQGIARFIQSREKQSFVHRHSLADFYVREASLYTRETLDLVTTFQKSPSFSRLHQKIRKEAQEKRLSLETAAQSQEIVGKFSALLDKNPSLKTVALDIVNRLSEGEKRWKEATEALSTSGGDAQKVFKEDFAELHERLKRSLQGIPPVDGKKLQEMARALIENLKELFSRLLPFQKQASRAPQI